MRPLLIALVLLGGLGVLTVAGIAGFATWLNSNLERITDPFAEIDPATRPSAAPTTEGQTYTALNVLVLGSDSRISAGDPTAWSYGAQRTDAIMIAHISADRQSAQVMSIPRDSWVPIPGHGTAKINAAYSYGGPPLMIETVEALTGIRIDHFVIADFESFTTLTDALGGVEITVPEDTYDRGNLVVRAGTQTLDGETALRYTRQRYGLPGGDFDRVKRQQNWMRAIAEKAISRETLTNPVKLTNLLTTVSKSVAVDETLGIGDMRSIATSLSDLRTDDITFLTAPVSGTGWSPDGKQSIVNLNYAQFTPLVSAIAQDTVAGYITEHAAELNLLDPDNVR
ncbi:MAG: LCP family protein [Cellulomonadaceae bacterium]